MFLIKINHWEKTKLKPQLPPDCRKSWRFSHVLHDRGDERYCNSPSMYRAFTFKKDCGRAWRGKVVNSFGKVPEDMYNVSPAVLKDEQSSYTIE